jgi:hypothetical protein
MLAGEPEGGARDTADGAGRADLAGGADSAIADRADATATPAPLGTACVSGSTCASGFCADGYCCDGACSGKCEACDLGATLGRCTPVTRDQPRGERGSCGGTGPCAGSCTAVSRTACTFPDRQTSCRTQSCSGTMLTAAAVCDGAGLCPTPAIGACPGGLTCDATGTACRSTCRIDGDCVAPTLYCQAGACTAARPNASACVSGGDCQSGICADGRCCDLACGGQCEACDVDGAAGTCVAVPSGQQPHGSRRPGCAGSGACMGRCDGSARTACGFPGLNTVCTAPCPGVGVSGAGLCDGAGICALSQAACL